MAWKQVSWISWNYKSERQWVVCKEKKEGDEESFKSDTEIKSP